MFYDHGRFFMWCAGASALMLAALGSGRLAAADPVQIDAQTIQLESLNPDSGEKTTLRLWIPPGIAKLRGVIVCGPGANQQKTDVGLKYAQLERWQILAQRHGFGLVGVQWTSYIGGNPINASDGSADLDVALKNIGIAAKHPELDVIPVAIWGMSASGGFSFEYALNRPNRCLAFFDNKGGTISSYYLFYSSGQPDMMANFFAQAVPGVLCYDERNLYACATDGTSHLGAPDAIADVYVKLRRSKGLITVLPDWGISHVEWGYGQTFALSYFDRIIEARLPSDYQPGTAANLVKLSENEGWLGACNNFGYRQGGQAGTDVGSYSRAANSKIPAIVKRSSFTGTDAAAFDPMTYTWLPDEYLARLWQAASVYTHAVSVTTPPELNGNVADPAYIFDPNTAAAITASARSGYTPTGFTWFDGLTQFDNNTTGVLTTSRSLSFGLHPISASVMTSVGTPSLTGFSLLAGRRGTPAAPAFTTQAAASPAALSSVTGSATLSAVAVPSDGGLDRLLTYTWSKRSGPGNVTFGANNGRFTASRVSASFSAAGTYVLDVVVSNAEGMVATSQVAVPVAVAAVTTGSDVVVRIPFDEGKGATAADVSGGGNNATLVNGLTWTTGVTGSCGVFTKSSSQYATLPSGIAKDLGDCTISAWVYPATSNRWQRVFDFGTGTNNYMFLTTTNGRAVRFGIRTPSVTEQFITGTKELPVGTWSHVAVVLSGSTGKLYVNGALVGTNSAMTIKPSDLGNTTQNWLGRSQFSADPYLDGRIDDFRIYRRVLSSVAVEALASTTALATLRVHIPFDENSGDTAQDWSGNGWTATLKNAPAWTTGKLGSGVDLVPTSSQYASLPSGVVNGLSTCTVSAWVYLDGIANWQRVFDFGTGTNNYMFLTTSAGGTAIRFAIRTPSVGEQQITGKALLPVGAWTHVAVVLNGATGTLYVNGTAVGANTAMTLTPASLGNTTQNWLGRSQFASDPYLNGVIDDFRIYGGALTATQISSLAATTGGVVAALGWCLNDALMYR